MSVLSAPPGAPTHPEPTRVRVPSRIWLGTTRTFAFGWRVLQEFRHNRGFLLAGALGYNTLLSIVPLFALLVVVLSTIVDYDALMGTINAQATVLLPGRASVITEAFAAFVERRATVGVVGFAGLLFFAAIAFRMLDDAFAMVFHRNRRVRAVQRFRGFVLPLAYVLLIGVGILALTLVMVAFDALPPHGLRLFGRSIGADTAVPMVKLLAFFGLVLLLASFYWVMPTTHVRPRRALLGGLIASLLWEAVRSGMVWYFATLSLVDVVYGSLGTVVVLLLGLEVAAIILLLGAQIIAELELAASTGRRWYEPPRAGSSVAPPAGDAPP